jgi:GrpB-like predicted nucleotidyltransferase (UPF0157 family)
VPGSRMLLVGACLGGKGDGYEGFIGGLFPRLTTEVGHTGETSRCVGYRALTGAGGQLTFFGIQVDRIDAVPRGMTAWELDEGTLTVRMPDGTVSRSDVAWDWSSQESPGPRTWTGEFTCVLPEATGGTHAAEPLHFQAIANAYLSLHPEAASTDEAYLVDYDPAWPRLFSEFAAWLGGALGLDVALCIEHYGSTSIPGIPAKPILDVLVEIPSFTEAKRRALPLLNDLPWEYWWYGDHMTFIRRNRLMGERTHHIHMAPRGHRLWEGIAFRDHLRTHPDDAARYVALKRALSERYRGDRERYTREKESFIREIREKTAISANAKGTP